MKRALLLAICLGCTPAAHPASQASANRAPKRTTWRTAYVRDCNGSITPPLVSPSGLRFIACNAAFDLPSGRFLGRARSDVALFFSDERVISRDYAHGGLTLGPLFESKAGSTSRVSGRFVSRLVVSPQRDRLVSVEHGGRASARASDELSWVVLRSLSDGSVLDEAALELGTTSDGVAFFADGAAVVLANHSCRTRRCDERGASSVCVQTSCDGRDLFALDNGALQPLGERYRGLSTLAVAENGTRAVLTWADRRELVELPSGRHRATLSMSMPDHEHWGAALDPAGRRAAFFTARGLTIVDVSLSERVVTLHDDATMPSGELGFSPDGRSLLVLDGEAVRVLREGLPLSPRRPPAYSAQLPHGFEAADPDAYAPPGMVAHYSRETPWTEVLVTASDADEFGRTPSRDQWAALVLERNGHEGALAEKRIRFDRADARAFEFSYFRREGCDPIDIYFRFEERGAFLYRIEIHVPPGTPAELVQPLVRSFFDAPRGNQSTARRLPKGPGALDGPC